MLRTLFVLSVLVPGFVMALRDRFMALLVYLWYGFFRPQDFMWIDITALRPSLVLGFVLIVPSFATGIFPNLTHPLSIGSALFLGSAFVSQITAVNPAVGWHWIDFLTRLIVVCLLAVTLITSQQRLLLVTGAIGASLGFHAAKAGLASLLGGGARFYDGLGGAFADNNGYALGTVMIIPLLLAVALNAELLFDAAPEWLTRNVRRGFFIAIPLCAFTVVSTFSRGGFLALAAATLVYIGLHRQRVRLSLSLAAVAVLGLSFVPIPKGYFDRLETIQTYEKVGDDSALSRPHFWRVAVRMAEASPLGVGTKQYENAYDRHDFSHGRFGTHRSVHSSHFQVLGEQGYPGALVWMGQFGYAFWVAMRVRRLARRPEVAPATAHFFTSVSNCLIASMAGFLVGGSFVASALNDVTWLTFALLAALDRLAQQAIVEAQQPVAAVAVGTGAAVPRPVREWRPPVRTPAREHV
jgi:putative inorganic carbon (HCO3(-)) transporter